MGWSLGDSQEKKCNFSDTSSVGDRAPLSGEALPTWESGLRQLPTLRSTIVAPNRLEHVTVSL